MSEALIPLGTTLLTLAAGFLLGLAHFASLRTVTAMLLSGRHPARAIALQVARMGVAVAVFAGFAFAGALPLICGALGFLLGRAVVLRRSREET